MSSRAQSAIVSRERGPATLQDVARAAGVSAKTVSRVINHEPGVHAETLARVQDAIAMLGYRRNDAARNLRMGISLATIGLLIEDLANPFYAGLARAVEQVAYRHGHAVTITSSGEDPARERELLIDLLRRGVDGLLVVPAGQDHRYLVNGFRHATPVVFLDRLPGGIEADAVVLDNVVGARQATEHLLAHGHRRIAYVGDGLSVTTSAERLQGYRDALRAHGVSMDESLVRTSAARVDASQASTRLLMALPQPPTAILAQNNRNCLGVLRVLGSLGRRCAVVGFDDFELADMLPVPVTVVSHDPGEMGRAGAELLFSRMAGDSRPPQRVVIPTRLIQRGSGELEP